MKRPNSNLGITTMFGTKGFLALTVLLLTASLAKPAVMNWHHCGGKVQTAGCFKPSPLAQVKFFDLSTAKASER
jgi:hypothetical protein